MSEKKKSKWGLGPTLGLIGGAGTLIVGTLIVVNGYIVPAQIKANVARTEKSTCKEVQADIAKLDPKASTPTIIKAFIDSAKAHAREVDGHSDLSLYLQLLAGLDPKLASTANTPQSRNYDAFIAEATKICTLALK